MGCLHVRRVRVLAIDVSLGLRVIRHGTFRQSRGYEGLLSRYRTVAPVCAHANMRDRGPQTIGWRTRTEGSLVRA